MILLFLAVIPGIIFLFFVYRMDKVEKEPIGLIAKLFFAGVLSVIPIAAAEFFLDYIESLFLEEDTVLYILIENFIFVALVEEGGKFIVAKKLTWKEPAFTHVFDATVYAVSVSMGFAVLENILYVIQGSMSTVILRALLSVPGHGIYGIFMGAFLGAAKLSESRGEMKRSRSLLFKAVAVPTFFHGLYDFCLSTESVVLVLLIVAFEIFLYVMTYKKIKIYSAADRAIVPIGGNMNNYRS